MPPHYTKKYTASVPDTCGACGRQGHRNSATSPCPLPTVPWDRLGIEVEGFWEGYESLRVAKVKAVTITGQAGTTDGSLSGDGVHNCESVDDDGNCDCDNTQDTWYAYEFRTRPANLSETISQMLRLYPDGTNNSAGMHVHVSFKSSVDIALLKCQPFFDYWRQRWEAWGKRMKVRESSAFWTRLKGHNQYCQVPRIERPYERYSQLNFDRAWESHQTLECRLLPMFQQAALAVSAVNELTDIYDAWLTGGLYEASLPKLHVLSVEPENDGVHVAEVPFEEPTLPSKIDEWRVLPTYHDRAEPGYALQPAYLMNDYNAEHIRQRTVATQTLEPRPSANLALLEPVAPAPVSMPPVVPSVVPSRSDEVLISVRYAARILNPAPWYSLIDIDDPLL